jgi:hypothetical protein
LIDAARVVVTELAANATGHARSPFSVTVRTHGSGVLLSIRDGSAVRPTVRPYNPLAASGRGLLLVAAPSADWGVEVTADGKTIWADLRAQDEVATSSLTGARRQRARPHRLVARNLRR